RDGGDDGATEVAEESASAARTDLDDILDEIDEVLETNAEEFVRSYVQKGGQ
ncbi:MAG: ubiquitin-like protein Pup, partial [Ilumatobacteraceae bacterium]